MQAKAISITASNYPVLLKEIASPPEKIFIKGALPDVSAPCIAIVGTRKATEEGKMLAKKTAKELAEKGFVIVSGLAMGIDTAAHEGAIKGGGKTFAVLGTGINKIYPAQNENLANRIILTGGAIISEYETNAPGFKWQFLERNRIVAGLCVATIVIEASSKSGSLVTARLAAESGREVFVFPGAAGHSNFKGSHALIRDGARLVNSTEDILEDLGYSLTKYEIVRKYEIKTKNSKNNPFPPPVIPDLPVQAGLIRNPAILRNQWMLNQVQHDKGDKFSITKRFQESQASQEKIYSASEKASPETKRILEIIKSSKTPLSIDKIIEITKTTPQEANQILTDLIIHGIVEETALGYRAKH